MTNFLVLLACLNSVEPAESTRPGDHRVYCERRAIRIPLDLSQAERSSLSSIRFFVSHDRGQSWQYHSDAASSATTHLFRADADGEYWFSIALVDATGRQTPPDIAAVEPGLKVVVDSKAPEMVLKPVRSKSGRRGVRWDIVDDNLDPNSIRMAVWEHEAIGWVPHVITDPHVATIWFADDRNIQKIQSAVKDLAGNETVLQVEVFGERFSKRTPELFALDAPAAGSAAQLPRAVASAANEGASVEVPPAPALPSPEKQSNAVAELASDNVSDSSEDDALNQPAKPRVPDLPSFASTTTAENATAVSQESQDAKPVPPGEPDGAEEPTGLATDEIIASLCGTRQIVINYAVDAAGSPGVAKVELWATDDHGSLWKPIASDDDLISPIDAELEHDGLWGLVVVVTSKSGVAERPAAGTLPEVYVYVDTEAPYVELEPVTVQGNRAVIRWKALDPNLTETPVQLSYAPTGDGPWQPIEAPLENTGEYVWNYARVEVEGDFYIRAQATDRVGNVGIATTEKPVSIRIVKPKGRVLSVQPKSNEQLEKSISVRLTN